MIQISTAAARRVFLCAVSPLLLFLPARSADGDRFPDGPGKAEFMKVCAQCHPVNPIASLRYSKENWKDLVFDMKGKGADATDEECNIIVDYLAKNFPE
ncbi:MAG: cytochrome c [Bryobacteraceae bacterium]